MSPPTHAILKWNPTAMFNRFAPDGIKLWLDVLRKFPVGSPECYVWWGKISVGRSVGMQPPERWEAGLNSQIKEQVRQQKDEETPLCMYCSDNEKGQPPSLHVGKVVEVRAVQDVVSLDDPHVPSKFYKSKRKECPQIKERFSQGKLIPYWFKLSDVRHVGVSERHNLWVYDIIDGSIKDRFDPTSTDPYPCGVVEKDSWRWSVECRDFQRT